MNKVIKQENELNLVIGARNIIRNFGPRKMVAILTLSSMLSMTACGKKEETIENSGAEVTYEDNTPKYRNRPLGGSIVDNHNKELYISKASDLESVVEGTEEVKEESKKTTSNTNNSNKSTNNNTNATVTNPQPQTSVQNNVVVDNTQVPAPDLLPGESVTYQPDGSYIVTPSQDYVNPPKDDTPAPQPEQPQPGEPSVGEPPLPEPPVEENNQGYVVRKINYSDGVYFHKFEYVNGEYFVTFNPIEYANTNDITTNIEALAEDDDAYNYALSHDWVGVGPYNFETYSFLDSVYNIEAVLEEREEEARKTKEEADKNPVLGLNQ